MEVQARKVAGVGYTYQVGPLPPMCLEARVLDDLEEEPGGERLMEISREGTLVGRFRVPREILADIEGAFQEPVSLLLSVAEGKETVRGTLFALLPRAGGAEGWRGEAEEKVGVPIARARRLGVERRFPASLPHEAGDLLAALLRGEESLLEDRELRSLGL